MTHSIIYWVFLKFKWKWNKITSEKFLLNHSIELNKMKNKLFIAILLHRHKVHTLSSFNRFSMSNVGSGSMTLNSYIDYSVSDRDIDCYNKTTITFKKWKRIIATTIKKIVAHSISICMQINENIKCINKEKDSHVIYLNCLSLHTINNVIKIIAVQKQLNKKSYCKQKRKMHKETWIMCFKKKHNVNAITIIINACFDLWLCEKWCTQDNVKCFYMVIWLLDLFASFFVFILLAIQFPLQFLFRT